MRDWLVMYRGNMTHDEVAAAAKIQRAYYTMIENGSRTPSVAVAKRISEVLKFDWTIFFDHNSNKTLQDNSSA